ncbi:MAG: carbamoyl-phosphate synthase large subunit, partial [Chitinophagales bacterium]
PRFNFDKFPEADTTLGTAKLAVGYTLDELENDITRKNACFEPSIDYCVVKIPRFNFDKFPEADTTLGTAMKAVGEIMAIGRTFKEALQKGMRSMELVVETSPEHPPCPLQRGNLIGGEFMEVLEDKLKRPNSERLWYIFEAFERGVSLEEVYDWTKIDRWFLYQVKQLTSPNPSKGGGLSEEGSFSFIFDEGEGRELEVGNGTMVKESVKIKSIQKNDVKLPSWEVGAGYTLRELKQLGFSDLQISNFLQTTEAQIRNLRKKQGIIPTYKLVDTCAGEFEAYTPYYYSTYEDEDESVVTDKKKVIVIGSGPNRIGQGIEFDYCCVHAAIASKAAGYEVIMVNSNPETVSTDFDVSDKLYFEPITFEDVMNIYEKEQPEGIILQFGGQTPLNLASRLAAAGVNVLGTSPESIHQAEDRDEFQALCQKLQIRQPVNRIAYSFEEMKQAVVELGYPVIVRPSHVLGGARMKVIYKDAALEKYIQQQGATYPILVESFLEDAVEIDVDALGDGEDCVIAAIMEHVEPTGIHSGDSACVLPTYSISSDMLAQIKTATKQLAKNLKIIGLMNIQFAVKEEELYIIEVNPRASRTVPFVSKATGIPWGKLATEVVLGKKVVDLGVGQISQTSSLSTNIPLTPFKGGINSEFSQQRWAVKEVVFPFNKCGFRFGVLQGTIGGLYSFADWREGVCGCACA